VGPRACLDTEARGKNTLPLAGIEPRLPGRPVSRQTLYCLSYPGPTPCSKNLKSRLMKSFDRVPAFVTIFFMLLEQP
jgi:hypothetical protein